MRKIIILTACALSAACQARNAGPAAIHPRAEAAAPNAPFFAGRWAAKKALCSDAAWEITPTRLSTPGHVVCAFRRPQPASVYRINAVCTAEGPPAPYHLRISYAQSAKALLIEGGPFRPIGLVKCGQPF